MVGLKESTISTETSISNILSQIKKLNPSEKIDILEEVVSLIKNENVAEERITLSSIYGLGSEIWKETDIDNYIDNERQWE